MTTRHQLVRLTVVSAGLLLALLACGGSPGGGSPPASAVIGSAGGTLAAPSGARVVVPPGALAADTTITIEQTSAGSPALPGGLAATGPMFAFTPHGTTFAVPVTVTLPHNPAAVPAGGTPQLYKTNASNGWEPVPGATFGAGSVSGSVSSFSFATVVVPPLQRNDPLREWRFSDYRGRSMTKTEIFAGVKIGGLFEDIRDFGPVYNLTPELLDHEITSVGGNVFPQDRRANGQVFSTADGVTYGVFAEAPYGNPNDPDSPAGSTVLLRQFQSFIKRAADATLTFTLTSAFIDLRDDNGGFNHLPSTVAECNYPPSQVGALDACQDLVRGQVIMTVQAYTNTSTSPGRTFYYTAGTAEMRGHTRNFVTSVPQAMSSRTPLWSANDFEVDILSGFNGALMSFKGPRTYTIDLSSIGIGEEFTLSSTALAEATNRQGNKSRGIREAPSAAAAFLRDPLSIGGTTLTLTGLEPTNNPGPVPPVDVLVAPAPCVPGPDPAGVLQFSAASYSIEEFGGATQPVRITRTGGSRGAVTATLATSDGSARAGTDYTPVNATVFFADGDTEARVAEIPIIHNVSDEPNRTVNLTLSQPGGCATLGTQNTAVLTILDDELPPPPPDPNSFLDPGFGTAGKATTERFGGDDTAMALQPDGKIVLVGGSTGDFVLARYTAGGTLDPSFGSGGKVTTDMIPGGIVEEVARGVAIQPDGKIVVAGYTGQFGRPGRPAENRFDFALARYNADGTPDPSFDGDGKVIGGVIGRAFGVALQPDGKIVVAGDAPLTEDFAVARYNADGGLDGSFDVDGQLTTDIGGASNLARNVVLGPNGAIVVSGDPIGSAAGLDHTDLVRYTAGGGLDSSFDGDGKATLSGKRVGEGLALQPDRKLVLVGSATVGGVARFETMRLNANGSPDAGFGGAGAVSTDLTGRGDAAKAVALQGDGKIVVAGQGKGQLNPDFALVRYNADGTLDPSFADAGRLVVDFFGANDSAENVAVQPDGKIVLGGLARNSTNFDGYGLARVNP